MQRMKQLRNYAKATVSQKAEKAILEGHPWIYNTEIRAIDPDLTNGCLIDVLNQKGNYLGTGLLSEKSKIRIRLISRNVNDRFDEAFFERRLRHAIDYRKTVMGKDAICCRLIFGEADYFPGLTVDRFGDILVTQTLSLGMELLKPMLFPILFRILNEEDNKIDGVGVRAIYERNDVAIRELEGLEQNKGYFPLEGMELPDTTHTTITENGILYDVDYENGQKTGFFLDQKYNRQAVARLSKGKKVLDCFTHTGSFGLNAAMGGAEHVLSVDISESAIEMAKSNAIRNGLEKRMAFQTANVFDLLPSLEKSPDKFDFIILDPPAFTKSRQTVDGAIRGYKEINLRAMKLLPRGGYLATCSCSHFMEEQLFCKMLRSAAKDASVSLRQIEARQQSPDHPVLWNVPETNYLKFYLFQVV